MGWLDQGIPVTTSIHAERGKPLMLDGLILMHPYDYCILKGGIPELIRWMGERAERRIEALIEGRPLPAWPS